MPLNLEALPVLRDCLPLQGHMRVSPTQESSLPCPLRTLRDVKLSHRNHVSSCPALCSLCLPSCGLLDISLQSSATPSLTDPREQPLPAYTSPAQAAWGSQPWDGGRKGLDAMTLLTDPPQAFPNLAP